MRYRRPDSNREPGVTVIGVRISRSICCRTLPPNRGSECAARRGKPAVLLTALALQVIHRIHRHEVAIHDVLHDTRANASLVDYTGTAVPVCTVASSHAITSARL